MPFGLRPPFSRCRIDELGAASSVASIALISNRIFGVVDAHDRDCDRIASSPLRKLTNLALQVRYDPINLLDHRLREHFALDSDFDCGDSSAANLKGWRPCDCLTWNQLSESPVSSARQDSVSLVGDIYDTFASIDTPAELGRLSDVVKVFKKVDGDVVILIGLAVQIWRALEQAFERA